MSAVVVFESMFGNTREVAGAVAEGLRRHLDVTTVEVAEAVQDPDAELLVVGGPTHAFGMSRPATRSDAADRVGGAVISYGRGLREWLAEVADGRGRFAAGFDTRMKVRGLPGSAARGVVRRLRRRGYRIASPPRSFYVADTEGPLRPGEIDQALQWGDDLGLGYLSAGYRRHSA